MHKGLNALLVTEVRVYEVDGKIYAESAFAKILERYYKNFGKLVLVTRIIPEDKKRNGYVSINEFCSSAENIGSIFGFLRRRMPKNIVERIQKSDLIILRLPSLVSVKFYPLVVKLSKKYLAEVMGCAWDGYWNHGIAGKIIAPFMFFKTKRIVKNADYCIYVTQRFLQNRYPCGEKAKSIGISNVDIHNIAEPKTYKKFDPKNFSIMTAAALNVKYKGQEYVIKAISELKKKYGINANYYIAGKGDADRLIKIAKKYNVEKNVVVLGMLPKDELIKWMRKVDFYIQPSLQEGLPRSLIEAMSQGTVCFGSNTAGIPELLDDKYVFGRRNSEIIAKMLSDKFTVADLNRNSKRNIEQSKKYLSGLLDEKRRVFCKNINDEKKVTNKNKSIKTSSYVVALNYIVIPVICLVASVYILLWNQRSEYNLMFLLPIVFLICYEFLLLKALKTFREFGYVYSIVSFVRFVILPVLTVLSGRYDGRSSVPPSTDSFKIAFTLMIYEIIVCSIFIFFFGKKLCKEKKDVNKNIALSKNKWFYYIFIVISIFFIILNPNILSALSFIMPNRNGFNYDDFGIVGQITILFSIVGKDLIFILLLNYMKDKYHNNPSIKYVWLSIVLIIINSSIYFGTNRFDFVLNLVASTILFCIIFKKYRKIIVSMMMIFCVAGFIAITQVRNNYYSVSKDKSLIYDVTDTLQIYLGGPYNVAMSVETAIAYPEGRNIGTALYDITRPVLGINIFVKNIENVELTTHYFNWRIFNKNHQTQIIPMIGEGYYLFGFLLAPVFDVLFITIAFYLRKLCMRKNDMFITFFVLITLVRLGFINCQSATIQMNDLSFNLFLPAIIYVVNGGLPVLKKQLKIKDKNE